MKKKLFFLLLINISLTATAGTITFSGKIANMKGKNVRLRGLFYEHEIATAADGTFSDTFEIDYKGSFTFYTKSATTIIYLAPDASISVTANDEAFFETVKFSGDLHLENQYLAAKMVTQNALDLNELYLLDENDFVRKNESIRSEALAKFHAISFSDTDFTFREERSIEFDYQFNLYRYEGAHAGLTKQPFKVSDKFPKFDTTIDIDNDGDYLYSPTYRMMTFARFSNRAYGANAVEDSSASKLPFTLINSYKSEWIRNAMMKTLQFSIEAGNPDNVVIYNDLKANVTNARLMAAINDRYLVATTITDGCPSPVFNYENHKGGKTSLTSLKGNYVYIDVWATWCEPCLKELPDLQKIGEKYKGKKITFVSISLDSTADYNKWKKMVAAKNLGGIQLLADKEIESDFIKKYGIIGIPRFILIDPNGVIVNANAPRPSTPELIVLLDKLVI